VDADELDDPLALQSGTARSRPPSRFPTGLGRSRARSRRGCSSWQTTELPCATRPAPPSAWPRWRPARSTW